MNDNELLFQDWLKKASKFQAETRPFINGKYISVEETKTYARHSPIDGSHLADVTASGKKEVDYAVDCARIAFNKGYWSNLAPKARKAVMLRFADLIESHKADLALINSIEMGKPIFDSLRNDVKLAVECIRWYAELGDKLNDECTPPKPNVLATMTREALGVVAAIIPWNFPLVVAAWKIGPALAAGNSLILKPSEQSPLSAIYLGQLAAEAGIPAGVFNVLPGLGNETGQALARHSGVDGVFFTGSTTTGLKIQKYAGESNMKKVGLECGGKGAFIVLSDCERIEEAADSLAQSLFFNQGQICSAPSRLIIHESRKEQMIEALQARLVNYEPAHPLLPATRLGAVVDGIQLRKIEQYVTNASAEGCTILAGGKSVEPVKGGFYYTPTLIDGVQPNMEIAQEEVFGPVLSVLTVDNSEQAINVANNTRYGLASAVWSDNIDSALQTARKIRCGTIHVNSYGEDDLSAAFGGFKQSGLGKDKSIHALREYCEIKTTWIKLRSN